MKERCISDETYLVLRSISIVHLFRNQLKRPCYGSTCGNCDFFLSFIASFLSLVSFITKIHRVDYVSFYASISSLSLSLFPVSVRFAYLCKKLITQK